MSCLIVFSTAWGIAPGVHNLRFYTIRFSGSTFLLIFLFRKYLLITSAVYPNALQTNFIMDANTTSPDQTDPKGAV